ncbi:unnamed protein product [Didymodactylos carnosus]|uniref:Uncharacterized protein n=1 Tax=Didymodactylos carnosus TaxID=1234261 RepID=A0A814G8T8_9BILA|nr:unnamed protein product [Didymodactylos carnosus]CAF3766274.1 unnamed protein product [Didymodactylos carnosus]
MHTTKLVETITYYSDYIVIKAITNTTNKLMKYKIQKDSTEEKAHKLVYTILLDELTVIQHKWNSPNNVVNRLQQEKIRLKQLFIDTSNGVVGTNLLTNETNLILNQHLKDGFIKTFTSDIILSLQTKKFVHDYKVLQAYIDLDLIDLIERKNINQLIKNLKNSHIHYITDEFGTVIESIRAQMVHRHQNDIIKLHCGEPCPICKVSCHLEADHNSYEIDLLKLNGQAIVGRVIQILLAARKNTTNDLSKKLHDSYHQPRGLIGCSWIKHRYLLNQLVASDCATSALFTHRFKYKGEHYPFKKYCKIFPEWQLPTLTSKDTLKLREYIFYKYQLELSNEYSKLKCTEMPGRYKHHTLITIKNHLQQVTNETSID